MMIEWLLALKKEEEFEDEMVEGHKKTTANRHAKFITFFRTAIAWCVASQSWQRREGCISGDVWGACGRGIGLRNVGWFL